MSQENMNFLNSIWRYTPDLSSLNNIISDNVFKENIIKIEHFDFRLEHSKDNIYYIISNISAEKIQIFKKENRNIFETKEIVSTKEISLLGGPVYSFRIYLKFSKKGLSPVSSIFIKRQKTDVKTLALSLDDVYEIDVIDRDSNLTL